MEHLAFESVQVFWLFISFSAGGVVAGVSRNYFSNKRLEVRLDKLEESLEATKLKTNILETNISGYGSTLKRLDIDVRTTMNLLLTYVTHNGVSQEVIKKCRTDAEDEVNSFTGVQPKCTPN